MPNYKSFVIFGYVFAEGLKGETTRITPLPASPGPQGPDGLPGPPGVPGEYICTKYSKNHRESDWDFSPSSGQTKLLGYFEITVKRISVVRKLWN